MTLNAPIRAEPAPAPAPKVKRGDYLHSHRELYRVESLDSNRVLLEQCRTNAMVEVSLERLDELQPVRLAATAPTDRD